MEKAEAVVPERLKTGDTIGIAAPASPFEKELFYRGIEILKAAGFSVYIPDGIFKKKGYLAGSDRHRAELLNRLFADTSIKAIMCARGGFGSIRVLPLLDFDMIKKNPKIFIGFSDITALLSVLYEYCGLVTFHGPMLTSLEEGGRDVWDAMFMTISSDARVEIYPKNPVVLKPGSVSGIVSGGNLSILCHLMGTPFEPCFKGRILILEDIGEPAYKIDRMLTQMKLGGCFKGLSGLALGAFEQGGSSEEIYKIVKNIFKDQDIPILAGFKVGHIPCNITFPIGLKASLDTEKGLFYHDFSTC